MALVANFKTTSLIIALLSASGCILIPDGKPLSDPYVSPVDEKLCGVWRFETGESDPAQYLFIEKSQAKGNPVLLKLVFSSHRDRDKDHTDESTAYCSTTTLGDFTYLNVLRSEDLGAPDSYKEWIHRVETNDAMTEWATVEKYRLNDGHLDLWRGVNLGDKAYAAVVDGKRTPAEMRAALIKHLKSTGGETLFPETSRERCVRVK